MNKKTKKCKDYWLELGYSEDEAILKCKEYNSSYIEYWLKHGYTTDQAKQKILEQSASNIEYWLSQGYNNTEATEYANIYGSAKAYNKKLYRFKQKEYWLAQGYSEDEAIIKIKYYCSKNKKQPDYWLAQGYSEAEAKQKIRDNNPTSKRYWITRGYSESEAAHEIRKLNEKFPEYWIERGYSEKDAKSKAIEILNSTCVMSVSYWLKRGYSEAEAKYNAKAAISRTIKNLHSKWDRSCNRFTYEFWLKRGYSEDEAKKMAKKVNAENTKNISYEKRSITTKRVYEKMSQDQKDKIHSDHSKFMKKMNGSHSPCFKMYWINRGYSDADAKQQAYLTRLSGRREAGNLASKIECKCFDELSQFLNIEIIRQKWVTINNKVYCQDGRYNNFVFEFNGTRFHLDPRFYSNTDTDPFGRSFNDVREKDQRKIDAYIQKQYNIIIIWEHDYLNNKKKLFESIQEIITNVDENKKSGSYWSSNSLLD